MIFSAGVVSFLVLAIYPISLPVRLESAFASVAATHSHGGLKACRLPDGAKTHQLTNLKTKQLANVKTYQSTNAERNQSVCAERRNQSAYVGIQPHIQPHTLRLIPVAAS